MPGSVTITVGAQSVSRSSSATNAELAQLLRDGAEALGAGTEIDLGDPVLVGQWWLGFLVTRIRRAAKRKREEDVSSVAVAGVAEVVDFS